MPLVNSNAILAVRQNNTHTRTYVCTHAHTHIHTHLLPPLTKHPQTDIKQSCTEIFKTDLPPCTKQSTQIYHPAQNSQHRFSTSTMYKISHTDP